MSLYRGKTKKRQMLEVDKQPWLPRQVQVTLHDLMGAAKEGLLALAVAVGVDVLRSMMEAEVTAIVGPKGKHNPNRKAFRHGAEEGRVVLGGRKVPIQRPRVRTKDGQEVRLSSGWDVASSSSTTSLPEATPSAAVILSSPVTPEPVSATAGALLLSKADNPHVHPVQARSARSGARPVGPRA